MLARARSLMAYAAIALAVCVCACLLALIVMTTGTMRTIAECALAGCAILGLAQFALSTQWLKLKDAVTRAEEKTSLVEDESRAKATVVGTISHDLRTQLNAIIGFADVLSKGAFGPLGSPRYEEYAANIRASGQGLLNVVNDLFQLSQLSTMEGELTCQPIDVGTTTSKAAAQLHPQAAEKNITMKIDVLPRPIWGFAQREALKQVLSRIIDNAIKYTEPGGMIVVSVVQGKQFVDVMVTDNGPGIPSGRMKMVQRGSASKDGEDRKAGAGLGLVISRRLTERMEGKLIVESIVGRGTRVTIRLHEAELEAAPKTEPSVSGFRESDPFRAAGKRNPFNAAA